MAEQPADLNLRNLFAIRTTKWVQILIETRLYYEEQVSKKVQIENIISAGLMINL